MHSLIWLVACAAPLLPGEAVLGVDRPASFTWGAPGDRLGAAVAGHGASWLAAAPGADATWSSGVARGDSSVWVGYWDDLEVLVTADGSVVVDGVSTWVFPDVVSFDAGPNGVLLATASALHTPNTGVTIAAEGVTAVAWGELRILALVCAPECRGEAWTLTGEPLGSFAEGGPGGDVGEWQGLAWAGDPMADEADGAGRVCAEDGRCVEGLPGDHLGGSIGGGYAVGEFNKWVVPARGRVVPLEGGSVLVLEEGAETQPILLGGDEQLIVGAPYMARGGLPAGAVVSVPP